MAKLVVKNAGFQRANGQYSAKGAAFVNGNFSIFKAKSPALGKKFSSSWVLGWTGEENSKKVAHMYCQPAGKKDTTPNENEPWECVGGLDPAPTVEEMKDPEFENKYNLIRSIGEECQTEAELRTLLQKKPGNFRLYDGFEPSGRMHIAQGIFKAVNVNKATAAGGTFVFWIADWFGLMNDKMGGDLEKIKVVGQYFVEVWRAAGMDLKNVEFVWCSDEITGSKANQYWTQMLDVARLLTFKRVKKCCQIMGREENKLTAAQILYPVMQCTDIFFLRADICQLGVDQRKVNMRAREYCQLSRRRHKPIILSHHMLYGLVAGQAKMSKSNPDSAIFMEDTESEVRRKIKIAYCPRSAADKTVEDDNSMTLVTDDLKNPCLDYVRYIVLAPPGATFTAGGKTYSDPDEVKKDFIEGRLSEADLKDSLSTAVNALIEPVRQHFQNDPTAKDLLAKVRAFKKIKTPAKASFRRSKVLDDKLSGKAHCVFAPLPTHVLTLASVLQVIHGLEAGPKDAAKVLWCPDWSAIANNSTNGEDKPLGAYYTLLEAGVKAVAPNLKFDVVKQSETILQDPSNYWISVINVGRTFNVSDLEKASGVEEFEMAGHVISCLMHVGDLITINPATVCFAEEGLLKMSSGYLSECGLTAPKVVAVETPDLTVPKTKVLDESFFKIPNALENINIMLLDPENRISPKMKKCYCNANDTKDDFNPPLSWAAELLRIGETITVTRKPENGGEVVFKGPAGAAEIQKVYAAGELHPGDLKPAVKKALVEVMSRFQAAVKKDGTVKKAEGAFKQFVKKQLKKK